MASKDNDFKPEDIENLFDQSFRDFDDFRSNELNDLLVIKQSKALQLNRERTRLERKYGKDHPRVEQAEAKISYIRFETVELQHEIHRAETPTPEADEKAWLVHGFVWNEDGNPSGEKCVKVFNDDGGKIDGARMAVTDNEGYFSLKETNLDNYPEKVRVGISPNNLSDEAFTPRQGQVDYTEVGTKADPCDPPPETKQDWVITGTVSDSEGNTLKGLSVKLYKDDDFDNEPLGIAQTDENGVYRFSFSDKTHGGFFKENPEVHFVVENNKKERIFHTQVKTNFGEDQIFKHDLVIRVVPDIKKDWVITGIVTNTRKEVQKNLIVKIYKDDDFDNEPLGTSQTDEKGVYQLSFSDKTHGDFFRKNPEIHFVVENKDKERLFQKPIKTNFGEDQISRHDLVIKILQDIKKNWVITGTVSDSRGAAQKNLIVKIYKDDDFDNEPLGTSQTDEKGVYLLSFPDESHGDFFKENPEVHFVVENKDKERIFNIQNKTNFGEDQVSKHDLKIKVPSETRENWTITGKVINAEGKAERGLLVEVYKTADFDKDPLGKTKTNAEGDYQLIFSDEQHGEFFKENPEIHFVLQNGNQRVLVKKVTTDFGEDQVSRHNFTTKAGQDTQKKWVITGSVFDARGKTLAGVTVKLFETNDFDKNPFGTEKTNPEGTFRAEFPDKTFKEFFENLRVFFVLVQNQAGKIIIRGQEKPRFGDDLISNHTLKM